jgi:hypothetical protein
MPMPNVPPQAPPVAAPVASAVPRQNAESYFAPRPTAMTVALRTFIPWQLFRFVVINVRMLRMISKSHG